MSERGIVLYDPTAEPRTVKVALAPRLGSLQGTRAGILEHARFPLGLLGEEYRRFQTGERGQPDDALLPIADSADTITVIVVGGAGKHSCWQPTFGRQTRPVHRVIARRDGSPLKHVADLRG